jgi:hypothetical protein
LYNGVVKLGTTIFCTLFDNTCCGVVNASGGSADVSRAKLLKKFDQNFLLPLGRVWFTVI